MIRLVLLAGLLGMAGFVVFGRNSSLMRASKKLLFLAILVMGGISIVQPQVLQWIADILDVGRGTDLLVYLLTIFILSTLLMTYLEFQKFTRREAKLIQQVALLESKVEDLERHE